MVVLNIFFTYFLSSISVFVAFLRLSHLNEKYYKTYFIYSLAIGPILISNLLIALLYFFPKQNYIFYKSCIYLLFLCLFAIGAKHFPVILKMFKDCIYYFKILFKSFDFLKILLFTFAVFLVLYLFTHQLFIPIYENDAAQYLYVSSNMYLQRDVSFYPLISPDEKGFYAISSHPLGYYGLMIWSYMQQNTAEYAGLCKFISPFYTLYTTLIIWFTLKDYASNASLFAILLFLLTPIYYLQTLELSIDSLRICLLFLSILSCIQLTNNYSVPKLIFTGLICGLSLFTHSLGGVFTPLFVGALCMLYLPDSWPQKFLKLGLIGLTAMFIGGWQYIENILTWGAPFYDTFPIIKLVPNLKYTEWVYHSRDLSNIWSKLFCGILQGFFLLKYFSFSHWVFLFASIFYLSKRSPDKLFNQLIVATILFFALVVFLMLIDNYALVANSRYMMTMLPLMVCLGGFFLGKIYDFQKQTM